MLDLARTGFGALIEALMNKARQEPQDEHYTPTNQ
jgi:hypothetical protein